MIDISSIREKYKGFRRRSRWDRKMKKEAAYQEKYAKWLRTEPPQWRFIAHWIWFRKKPKF